MRRSFERMVMLALLLVGALVTPSHSAQAQGESTAVRPLRGRGLGGGRGARALQRENPGPKQQALQKAVRQRFAAVVRTRLNLTDEQAQRLEATDQRFQRQRNQIGQEERASRQALAAALADSTGTQDQAKISQYMDQLVQAQHKRADLLEQEQKELGTFLTPVQRAKFLGLREQLNATVKQMRQQNRRDGADPKPPEL
jgi:Spy/CpxP family protein refolding chaperone